jgi:hypothetical protein
MCRYVLQEKLLMQRTLPPAQLRLLIALLDALHPENDPISCRGSDPQTALQQCSIKLAKVRAWHSSVGFLESVLLM